MRCASMELVSLYKSTQLSMVGLATNYICVNPGGLWVVTPRFCSGGRGGCASMSITQVEPPGFKTD
jgi:hypothetical protein